MHTQKFHNRYGIKSEKNGEELHVLKLLIKPYTTCFPVHPNRIYCCRPLRQSGDTIVDFQSSSHRRLVGDLSIFYRYFNGHCSQEIRNIIPVPLRRVRTTRSSTHSQPFQVSLPNPRTLSHKSSFNPRTCNLWNVLPSCCFPESYNLPSFKSNVNKLDPISLFA